MGLSELKKVLKVQGEHGNWDCNDYMLGMYNGMELGRACIEDDEPQYRRLPKRNWVKRLWLQLINRLRKAQVTEAIQELAIKGA